LLDGKFREVLNSRNLRLRHHQQSARLSMP
jgi:hypothetical protein